MIIQAEIWHSEVDAWEENPEKWYHADKEVLSLPSNLCLTQPFMVLWNEKKLNYVPVSENNEVGTPTEFFLADACIHLKPKQDASGTVKVVGVKRKEEYENKEAQEIMDWYDENKDAPRDATSMATKLINTLDILVAYIRELEKNYKIVGK